MVSPEFVRRNQAYVMTLRVIAEQRILERGSPELLTLIDQLIQVCDAWAGVIEPERDETGGAAILHTAAFARQVEHVGALASREWPTPPHSSPLARAVYWPAILALLVARAEGAHQEL